MYNLIVGTTQDIIHKLRENKANTNYDIIMVNGVFMYLNDADFFALLKDIKKLANKTCQLYFKESMGVGHRLTLNQVYSNELRQNYSAIYRSIEEYRTAFDNEFSDEYQLISTGDLFDDELHNRKETVDYYFVYRK